MVAPLVGAWIERSLVSLETKTITMVAPLVGAWIESSSAFGFSTTQEVAPLVGAWIERLSSHDTDAVAPWSLLL